MPDKLRPSSAKNFAIPAVVLLGLRQVGKTTLRGGFPDSLLKPNDTQSLDWRRDFIRSYLERDVPMFAPRLPAETIGRLWTILGQPAWQRLHLAGMYYLWISFVITFGKRIPMSPAYVLPVVVLLLALAFRLWPRRAFTSM